MRATIVSPKRTIAGSWMPRNRWRRCSRAGLAETTAVEETGGMHKREFDFSKLSVAERIQLAADLWDSIPPDVADVPLTEAQKAELDRRLEELEHDPDAGESWEVVRARLSGMSRARSG